MENWRLQNCSRIKTNLIVAVQYEYPRVMLRIEATIAVGLSQSNETKLRTMTSKYQMLKQ